MPRKASHGWSNRQQGGFRRGGPVRHILVGEKSATKKSEAINQSLTLAQASNIGVKISSICKKCSKKKSRSVSDLIKTFPEHQDKRLTQLKPVCSNPICRGKIIVLKYTLI